MSFTTSSTSALALWLGNCIAAAPQQLATRCACKRNCRWCQAAPPGAPADPAANKKRKLALTCWRERANPFDPHRARCKDCENGQRRLKRACEKKQLSDASKQAHAIAALRDAQRLLAANGRDGTGGAALAGPAALSTETAIGTGGSPVAAPQLAVVTQPVNAVNAAAPPATHLPLMPLDSSAAPRLPLLPCP